MSGIDHSVVKKVHGSETTVIFSNEEINNMIKIIKALEDSDILLKRITESFKNDVQKGGALRILPMLFGTLGTSLIANLLSGRGLFRSGHGLYRTGEGIKKSLMPAHPLTNFEIQDYYKNEPRFNGVYSRNNLTKIKNGAYVINLDEYDDIGTHWIALYCKDNEVIYFDSFNVEYIPKEIKKFIGNNDITTNLFRIQVYNSIMCGSFCILFTEFVFKSKKLIDFTNLFSPHDFKKNDKIVLNYFK